MFYFDKPVVCPNWRIRKIKKVGRAIPIGWPGLIGKCPPFSLTARFGIMESTLGHPVCG